MLEDISGMVAANSTLWRTHRTKDQLLDQIYCKKEYQEMCTLKALRGPSTRCDAWTLNPLMTDVFLTNYEKNIYATYTIREI